MIEYSPRREVITGCPAFAGHDTFYYATKPAIGFTPALPGKTFSASA
jgi:hypothetical protein